MHANGNAVFSNGKFLVTAGTPYNFSVTTEDSDSWTCTFSSSNSGPVTFTTNQVGQNVTIPLGTISLTPKPGVTPGEAAPKAMPVSVTVTVVSVLIAIEADIVDEPPPDSDYASGVNPNTIVLTLNGKIVTPIVTNIPNGKHIYYMPNSSELNLHGTNRVTLNARDNANANMLDMDSPGNPNDGGNPMPPCEWSFTLP